MTPPLKDIPIFSRLDAEERADLEEILGVELDRGVAREVKDALDEAAILADDIEGEPAALEVIEDAGMVAGDVHAAAEAREVDVHRRFLAVAAQHDRIGLHVVLEILPLELREPGLHLAGSSRGASSDHRHGRRRERSNDGETRTLESGFWRTVLSSLGVSEWTPIVSILAVGALHILFLFFLIKQRIDWCMLDLAKVLPC